MRAAIDAILDDDVHHGRVGWAYVAERVQRGTTTALAARLPELVARVLAPIFAMRPSLDLDDSALEAFGYLGPSAVGRLYREALEDVVFAGLER
ncbi:MAG: hypothetical protein ABI875_09070, partial [Gemmatimonadales bacterium]